MRLGRQEIVEFQGNLENIDPQNWIVGGLKVTITPKTTLEGTPSLGSMVWVQAWVQNNGQLSALRLRVAAQNGPSPSHTPEHTLGPRQTPVPTWTHLPTRTPEPSHTPGHTPVFTHSPMPTFGPTHEPWPTHGPTHEPTHWYKPTHEPSPEPHSTDDCCNDDHHDNHHDDHKGGNHP